jgi:hypothetical protein
MNRFKVGVLAYPEMVDAETHCLIDNDIHCLDTTVDNALGLQMSDSRSASDDRRRQIGRQLPAFERERSTINSLPGDLQRHTVVVGGMQDSPSSGIRSTREVVEH